MVFFVLIWLIIVGLLFISLFVNLYLLFSLLMKKQSDDQSFKTGLCAVCSIILTGLIISIGGLTYSTMIDLIYGGITGLSLGILLEAKRSRVKVPAKKNYIQYQGVFRATVRSLIFIFSGILTVYFLFELFTRAIEYSIDQALSFLQILHLPNLFCHAMLS